MPFVLRPVAFVAVGLTVIFSTLMLLIPHFAPDTAVLSYTVALPDRQDAIWLMDIQSGLSYFSGVATRMGSLTNWSPDGTMVVSLEYDADQTAVRLSNLQTGRDHSFPVRVPRGLPYWSPDMTRLMYYSAALAGTTILIDLTNGHETPFLINNTTQQMLWLSDERVLVKALPPAGGGNAAEQPNIYLVDITTEDVDLLARDLDIRFLTATDPPTQVFYLLNNQLFIAPLDALEEAQFLMTVDTGNVLSAYFRPPDQEQLVVSIADEVSQQVYLVNIHTGEVELFQEGSISRAFLPTVSWSADGSALATIQTRTAQSSTVNITQNGQEAQTFVINTEIAKLDWSPNNRYILVYPSDPFDNAYYIIDVETGSVRLMDTVMRLSWQPEGE